ncbi:uncharacterized protein LOC119068085 [Bradysia coprophila]|uniref:uncharacterized protein LOC119068085 n=1 Tax=Bradysia coprophila TaxID=38358 RepID=UPI00187DB2F5|nr:uncharacterized protein LOC119068085 [Bradysia coprophila]
MDEKQRVISTLRALLVFKKDATPLRELKHDYCELEFTNEIPCFEHKSVIDFLISSGEFTVNVEPTGLVTVREKPKLLSSHLKKASQQKTRSTPGSAVVQAVKNFICKNQKQEVPAVKEIELRQWNGPAENTSRLVAKVNIEVDPREKLWEQTSKTTTMDTIAELKTQSNPFIKAQEENDQKHFKETASSNRHEIREIRTKNTGNIMDRFSQSNTEKYHDSFNKLNRMCVTFTKSLTCNDQNKYRAVLQIDHVQYFGEGNTSDEANDNAASKYLHSFETGVHQKRANQEYLNDVVPNLSIIKLYEMYDELNYRTILRPGERHMFKTVVQVDSVNYYGSGKSFQHAAAAAADTCLQSIKLGRQNKLLSSTDKLLHFKQN